MLPASCAQRPEVLLTVLQCTDSPSPKQGGILAQTVNNAKVEKPGLGVLTLQQTPSGCVLGARVDVSYCLQQLPGVVAVSALRRDHGCRALEAIRATFPAGGTQAPCRTASDFPLLGFTHFSRSGERRFPVGSHPGKLPGR